MDGVPSQYDLNVNAAAASNDILQKNKKIKNQQEIQLIHLKYCQSHQNCSQKLLLKC